MAELPLVVVNIQRAGPSTGMPTKTEQADLLQAMYGRNGESPAASIVAASLAGRLPSRRLRGEPHRGRVHGAGDPAQSDGYIANGTEPWLLPDVDAAAADLEVEFAHRARGPFQPYDA